MSSRHKRVAAEAPRPTAAFTKAQLLRSARYSPQERDVLAAVLQEGQTYTHEQAARLVAEFRKRKVTQ
ncbi:hypothetical protein [Symbiobacterium terraclitae]|uniref:hypothetical protein n=1 Tax=Symbiobacterium terraclitae TaxID=557451 RepID=UPI0035B523A1